MVVFTPRQFIPTPRKAVARTQRKEGWVDLRAYWVAVETKDLVTTLGINPHFVGRPTCNQVSIDNGIPSSCTFYTCFPKSVLELDRECGTYEQDLGVHARKISN